MGRVKELVFDEGTALVWYFIGTEMTVTALTIGVTETPDVSQLLLKM